MENFKPNDLNINCELSGNALLHFHSCASEKSLIGRPLFTSSEIIDHCLNECFEFEKVMGITITDFLSGITSANCSNLIAGTVRELIELEKSGDVPVNIFMVLTTEEQECHLYSNSGITREYVAAMIDLLEASLRALNN